MSHSQIPNVFIPNPQRLCQILVLLQPWPGSPPRQRPLPSSAPSLDTPALHAASSFPSRGGAQGHGGTGRGVRINHIHTHTRRRQTSHTRGTQAWGESMQINPRAEPCYSINVPAPVISALARSVNDDSQTTSPFNWCHALLLLFND